MASEFLISPLSLDEQAAALCEFLSAKRRTLSINQAASICAALGLATGGQKTDLARKLGDELERHSLKVNHAACVEAVAKLCGGANWMRLRQTLLTAASGTGGKVMYFVQLVTPGDESGQVANYESIADAAGFILEVLAKTWTSDTVPSLCSVEVRPNLVSLELEHPSAPWVTFRLMKAAASVAEFEPLDFGADEVRVFCARMQRSLEFTYPGVLVMGAERSAVLPCTYILLPKLNQPATGFSHICQATMELYMWMGSLELQYPRSASPSDVLSVSNGDVLFTPRWVNGVDGKESFEDTDTSVSHALVKRLLRLRQVTRMTMTEFLSSLFSGSGMAATSHQFNRERFIEGMAAAGLTVKDVAARTELALNDVLRSEKYGYASAETLQKLADALGMDSANELLPSDEAQSIGIRVEDGHTFLRGLKDSHQWRIVLGESLEGEELEIARGIADALKEYVDLYQFASAPMGHRGIDPDEPLDDDSISAEIQSLLDDLRKMDLAVLVGRGLRYVNTPGAAKDMQPLAMLTGTICVERVAQLRTPNVQAR